MSKDSALSSNTDNNKVFIVNRSQIEGRLDAEYYRPEILSLEHKVRSVSSKKLRNYICRIASGATPSIKEEEVFYSDKENGIPFLRVQNLQTSGKISIKDVKYINQETHQNYLRRSQVGESDLLVKITGVGRMAIASVAPVGFVGNTNQHMVVIKTEDKSVSDYLASYLNLDFVERLASRRSTGGTRPALDYSALKSIPIIEGIDFNAIDRAERLKQEKEAEAKSLLDSIDDYLLGELGINLSKKDSNLKNRIFYANLISLSGKRFDTKPYDNNTVALKRSITNFDKKQYTAIKLSNIVLQSIAGDWGTEDTDDESYVKCLVVRATEFDNSYNINLDNSRVKYRCIYIRKYEKMDIAENDLLIEKSGGSPDQPVGRISILTKDILMNRTIAYSNFIHKIRVDNNVVNPMYLFCFLRTMYNIGVTEYMQSQTNGIRNLIMSEYLQQDIIIPIRENGKVDIDKQDEIANHILEIRTKAKALQQKAQDILDNAKREVEQMILGE